MRRIDSKYDFVCNTFQRACNYIYCLHGKQECALIKEYQITRLFFVLLPKLHPIKVNRHINYDKELEKINKKLLPVREEIYRQWKDNEFEERIKRYDNRKFWTDLREFRYQFMEKYLGYNVCREKEIKKELGLEV